MSEEDRIKMYIAQCKICLLAECMKDCKNCPFKMGKEIKENDHGKNPPQN